MTTNAGNDDDDANVPISVRLGTVVPPEDPEDWRRPLTWVAALGMLLGPIVALGWFLVAPPGASVAAVPGTWLVAAALVSGGVLTGATQIQPAWRFAGTLGGGLFGALAVVLVATVLSPETTGLLRASPQMVRAFVAAAAGVAGALAAASLMPALTRIPSRSRRVAVPAVVGVAVAALCVQLLFSL